MTTLRTLNLWITWMRFCGSVSCFKKLNYLLFSWLWFRILSIARDWNMYYFTHTFFLLTAHMLLTNISNIMFCVCFAVYVVIHPLLIRLEVHFSTVRVFIVGVLRTVPGSFIRFHLNAVIAYPCPFPTAFSQANKIFKTRIPLKFLLQKNQFIFILNRNKLAIVHQARLQALIPICFLLCRCSMDSVTRTIGFKCFTLKKKEWNKTKRKLTS